MKKTLFLVIFQGIFLTSTYCQGYGNTMIFGYEGGTVSPPDDDYCMNLLTFDQGPLQIGADQNIDLDFYLTDAAISDSTGHLLFYFNGIDMEDLSGKTMQNGDTLNVDNSGQNGVPQGAIILPFPGHAQQFVLFHTTWGVLGDEEYGLKLYYSIIDMSKNGGLGSVVQRKINLVSDTLDYGKLAVVRHANGRDWWLALAEANNNRFYSILLDPSGPQVVNNQATGQNRILGIGESFFSPDGSRYVMYSSVDAQIGQYVDIYDFDRCMGDFSHHEQIHLPNTGLGGGVAVSPNSRWLYVSHHTELFQYDLWADPVAPSQQLIAQYEPFYDPFPTYYHSPFLAPDDKIYVVTTSGSRTLEVIHQPDEPGLACAFVQQGLRLPCNNARSLPTFADYRLGPLDGSSCDTLGIDNVPVAWYCYEQDTLDPLLVDFHDLSYHEPATWSWDFGDGSVGSSERHPNHTFDSPGVYSVCLTVSNLHGTNTHCKTLYLGVSATQNPVLQAPVQVGPNPFGDHLSVALSTALRSPVFRLYDQMGRMVHEEQLALGSSEIETSGLPPGFYAWTVTANGERVKSGKCVKLLVQH